MSARPTVSSRRWLIRRTNRDGYPETIVYIGSLRDKPKGWKVVGPAP